MKKFLAEFREFTLRGNVMDLAVGVIIGGAFQNIVKSLTGDIISPIIGLFAKTDFSNLVIKLWDVEIKYGAFITAVINFIIMAFIIFLLVKGVNKLASIAHRKEEIEEEAAPTTKKCPYCMSEIAIEATKCPHCTSDL
ncbi:MAG: large conductance mechanosensitive channel protein MscL [Ruminococcaceae bacterium]|nr:large conductance mechanosensitive channel protein MscL [Oscillospiraceae bacterium]